MKKCERCQKDHPGVFGSGRFCSRFCANKREYSDDQRKIVSAKIGNSMRGKILKVNGVGPGTKPRISLFSECIVCKNTFSVLGTAGSKVRKTCSPECAYNFKSIQGRNSARVQAESRRSKNEKLLAEMCIDYFSNVLTNTQMFDGWDADIILEDHKIAIMWNGKWHYEKITEKHSVLQVQTRDRLKIKAIENNGYTPYVIKDLGGYNPDFVKQQFGDLVNWLSRGPHKAK